MGENMNAMPDAIAVLAGAIKRLGGKWVSTDLSEQDDTYGAPGQLLRVKAAAILARQYPHAVVVPSGGIGYDHRDPLQPPLASVMRDELQGEGVEQPRILVEDGSNSTFQQLDAISSLVERHRWQTIYIVTSKWHAGRVRAMIEAKFPSLLARAQVIDAERVLVGDSAGWQEIVDAAYGSPYLKARIRSEKEGIIQIRRGTYSYR